MNGQIDIPTIIKDYSGLIAVIFTILGGFLLWIFQHRAESRFTEKLESQKNEYNKQLEQLRTELSISRDKLNIYLPKQMEVTSTLWTKLQEAYKLLSDILINLESTSSESMSKDDIDEIKRYIEKYRQKLLDLNTFYTGNKILLPKNLQDSYNEVSEKFWNYFMDLRVGQYADSRLDDFAHLMDALEKIIKKILAINE
ncbi:MAG: hypothetical protein LUQ20_01990 [Candidatus Methanoperedens sp.]|nr:hypothetical protein [Candidatus Methanoperedens sp.]